ncbi:Cytochrome C [Vibrio rotiferianus]|uniref:c-type cytochrome n=1 Tax=Vibrio rotiferianus TaxID=190895 RepID=UPI0028961917|nr:Cytochrome C [Vibrio rotiferianus]
MKRMFILLIVSISFSAFASTETEKGKGLYIAPGKGGCATCHGETGNEPVMPMYPKIGGQSELYLFNQMKDYKMKKRKNGLFMTMEVAMEHYTDEEIRLMAKYLSAEEDN